MSRKVERRKFLKLLAAGGAQLAVGALGLGTLIPRSYADSHCEDAPDNWGAIEGMVVGLRGTEWSCSNHAGYKILEIFLAGGASQWETFWLPGDARGPDFSRYDMSDPRLGLNDLIWTDNTSDFPCEAPDIPDTYNDYHEITEDTDGGNIYWGAPAKPLYRRDDILSRCRMVTQYHKLSPHEAAVPYVMAGLPLGNPRRAGTGAAIQRRALALNPDLRLPVSYVLSTHSYEKPAAVTGTHPGFARPLTIRVQRNNGFVENLGRPGIQHEEADELLLALRHEYRHRLLFPGVGEPVRSDGFKNYWTAAELLKDARSLRALFADNMLIIDQNVSVCPTHPELAPKENWPGAKTMLHAAASLLSSGPARYVCVVDSGRTGSYDTHAEHLLVTSANLYNVLHHLADIVRHPTENPTGTLNLDDTMVVINTEFGREPTINGDRGRHHWPWGYVTLFIGGPITGGPSIEGAIDESGRTRLNYRYSPTDMRGALLLAAGVDPFASGNLRVGDFSEALLSDSTSVPYDRLEGEIRNQLRSKILGV